MDILIDDLFLTIIDFLNFKKILNLKLISKHYAYIISSNDDINDHIAKFKHCHSLDLSHTKVTDESVKELKDCHTLDLSNTNVTDESVKELKNCHTLYLSHTNVTGDLIKNLRLNGCKIIT